MSYEQIMGVHSSAKFSSKGGFIYPKITCAFTPIYLAG